MKLFFRNFGSGQPVIIMHGLLGMSDNWVTIGRKLAEEFSVFLPDLRNHGQSPHSLEINYEVMADDLNEFIEDNNIKNPVIVGHSMGGKVAMLYALNHPDMVKGLVVVDISPSENTSNDYNFGIVSAMMSVNLNAVHSREEVSEALQYSIPDEATRLFVMKNLHRKAAHVFEWRINLSAISNNLQLLVESIESEKVFTKPVLFIRGTKSEYIKQTDIPAIKRMFPNSEITSIEAGHWVHAEKPSDTFNALEGFIKKAANL